MLSDDLTLWDLLIAQAKLHPEHNAVVCGNRQLSTCQLVARAAELALLLRRAGAEPGQCVALYTQPSLNLMIGVWGILCAGCAYLPVSPEYPRERVRYMLEHSRTQVILCEQKLLDEVKALAPHGVRIVTVTEATGGPSPVALSQCAHPTPDDLAYVIYTSGSTGKPKGVMIEHKSIVHQMQWLRSTYGIGEKTVILQKTPMSFDAAQWEILAPVCGATVIMGTPGVQRDVQEIIRLVQHHGVTTLQCVPTLLRALVEADALRECISLTQIFSGGEALTRQLAQDCLEVLPGRQLVNLYGPTECTINASAHNIDLVSISDGPATVAIGTPVDGTQFHILDGAFTPVALGEVGELFISGMLVGRGYLHEPELTKENRGEAAACRQPKTNRVSQCTSRATFQKSAPTLQIKFLTW